MNLPKNWPKNWPKDWSAWIRQSHRWVSVIFALTVAANFVAMGLGHQMLWLNYVPLPPLFYLLFTGLYMFVRPYLRPRTPQSPAAGGSS